MDLEAVRSRRRQGCRPAYTRRVKLRVLWIGKTKDAHLAALSTDYSSRIARFLPVEIVEIKDPKRPEAEEQKLLAHLDSSDRVVVLDPRGRSWTSEQFAGFVG